MTSENRTELHEGAVRIFDDKDVSEKYAKYRPRTPPSVVQLVLSYIKDKYKGPLKQSLDVGCGAGQSTPVWGNHFAKAYGMDISETQVAQAIKENSLENVQFIVGKGEEMPFEDGSLELITCTAAVHWLDLHKFLKEANRALRTEGVLFVCCYDYRFYPDGCSEDVQQKCRNSIENLYKTTYGNWPQGVADFHDIYFRPNLLTPPFVDERRDTSCYHVTENMTYQSIRGLLRTFSPVEAIAKKGEPEKAQEIVNRTLKQYAEGMGYSSPDQMPAHSIRWDYIVYLGRKA